MLSGAQLLVVTLAFASSLPPAKPALATLATPTLATPEPALALPAPVIFATSIGAGTIAGLCGYYLVERPLLRAAERRKGRGGLTEAGV